MKHFIRFKFFRQLFSLILYDFWVNWKAKYSSNETYFVACCNAGTFKSVLLWICFVRFGRQTLCKLMSKFPRVTVVLQRVFWIDLFLFKIPWLRLSKTFSEENWKIKKYNLGFFLNIFARKAIYNLFGNFQSFFLNKSSEIFGLLVCTTGVNTNLLLFIDEIKSLYRPH